MIAKLACNTPNGLDVHVSDVDCERVFVDIETPAGQQPIEIEVRSHVVDGVERAIVIISGGMVVCRNRAAGVWLEVMPEKT